MSKQTYYLIEIFLPHPIQHSPFIGSLRQQLSKAFGGTTISDAQGTYLADPVESVTIIRVYVSAKHSRDEVIDYFTARKAELKRHFPDQDDFLVTFSEGYTFL